MKEDFSIHVKTGMTVLLVSMFVLAIIYLISIPSHSDYDIVADVKVVDKRVDTSESNRFIHIGNTMFPSSTSDTDYILVVETELGLVDILVNKREYDYYNIDSFITASINSDTLRGVIGVK